VKQLLLIILSSIISLIFAEWIVAGVIGYPRYTCGNRVYKIHDRLGGYNFITWRPPYYEKWNVEGGNKVVRYNNVGLYGVDIRKSASNKYIVLLGNSYIEGAQLSGERIAAGVLQQNLEKHNRTDYQVINLGSSAHDPYVLWYRLMFFKRYFSPSVVVLICESFDTLANYYSRWSDSELEYPDEVRPIQMQQNRLKNNIDNLRSLSACINLLYSLREKSGNKQKAGSEVTQNTDNISTIRRLTKSLTAYNNAFGDRFLFVSLMKDNPLKDELASFCIANKIAYAVNDTIMYSRNLLHGAGHLNRKGNQILGDVLFTELDNRGLIK